MAKRFMDCKEFNRRIPEFIDDTLMGQDARNFLNHMSECAECNEELQIQYLVREGVARLEDATNFNLGGELNKKVEEYKRDLKHRKQATTVLYIMEALAVLGTAFILILVFIMKS